MLDHCLPDSPTVIRMGAGLELLISVVRRLWVETQEVDQSRRRKELIGDQVPVVQPIQRSFDRQFKAFLALTQRCLRAHPLGHVDQSTLVMGRIPIAIVNQAGILQHGNFQAVFSSQPQLRADHFIRRVNLLDPASPLFRTGMNLAGDIDLEQLLLAVISEKLYHAWVGGDKLAIERRAENTGDHVAIKSPVFFLRRLEFHFDTGSLGRVADRPDQKFAVECPLDQVVLGAAADGFQPKFPGPMSRKNDYRHVSGLRQQLL